MKARAEAEGLNWAPSLRACLPLHVEAGQLQGIMTVDMHWSVCL